MTTQNRKNEVIANYGLYWERDKVHWWPGRQGRGVRVIKLLGRKYAIGRAHDEYDADGAVNFANQHGIYLLHNGFETVYVGQTTNTGLFQRIRTHGSEPGRGPLWDTFSWFGFKMVEGSELSSVLQNQDTETVSMRTLIKVVETIAIQACLPRLNGQAGQLLGDAYLQVCDPAIAESNGSEEQ